MDTSSISNLSIDKTIFQISSNNFNTPLNRLLQFGEKLQFKKGHVLFNVGNIARGFYMINSGKVKVSKFGVDGKEQIIKILREGDVLGHEALLYDQRFHEYAKIIVDAEIFYVSRDDFEQVYANEPSLMHYFIRALCNDLNRAEERLVSSAYEPVRGRLASVLMELVNIYKTGDQSVITISRSDLAKMVGTTKETSIRLLSEFKNEKLIDVKDNIIIKNVEGLNRIANMYK